jgi:hypothetical protein
MLSALFWTVIGIFLLFRGGGRLAGSDLSVMIKALILVSALLAGTLKAYLILDKAATRSISRILEFKDDTCLGAVYSIKTWFLVFCMMGLGILIRKASLPDGIFCFLYCTIGWALLLSSRIAWQVWHKRR